VRDLEHLFLERFFISVIYLLISLNIKNTYTYISFYISIYSFNNTLLI
jgi:hypothetical protein